jgi:hypothetical protein
VVNAASESPLQWMGDVVFRTNVVEGDVPHPEEILTVSQIDAQAGMEVLLAVEEGETMKIDGTRGLIKSEETEIILVGMPRDSMGQ